MVLTVNGEERTTDPAAIYNRVLNAYLGLAAARDVPFAGSLLAPVDVVAAADQANRGGLWPSAVYRPTTRRQSNSIGGCTVYASS